jgi:hypothetical protein
MGCSGYDRITSQSNAKPVRINLAIDESAWIGLSNRTQPSYCFVLTPSSPCSLTSICIRNSGSAFISVHGATIDQASAFMTRTSATRAAADTKTSSTTQEEQERVRAECDEDGLSFCSDAPVTPAADTDSFGVTPTVGSLIDRHWRVLVPLTQLLTPTHLVQRKVGKIDTIRTWRLAANKLPPMALIAVRCWPFYDKPATLVGPITVGLTWAAFFGQEHGWAAKSGETQSSSAASPPTASATVNDDLATALYATEFAGTTKESK